MPINISHVLVLSHVHHKVIFFLPPPLSLSLSLPRSLFWVLRWLLVFVCVLCCRCPAGVVGSLVIENTKTPTKAHSTGAKERERDSERERETRETLLPALCSR